MDSCSSKQRHMAVFREHGNERSVFVPWEVTSCGLLDGYLPQYSGKTSISSSTLKMEAADYSETLAPIHWTTRRHMPWYSNLREGPKLEITSVKILIIKCEELSGQLRNCKIFVEGFCSMEFVNIAWARLKSANVRASCPDIVRVVPLQD